MMSSWGRVHITDRHASAPCANKISRHEEYRCKNQCFSGVMLSACSKVSRENHSHLSPPSYPVLSDWLSRARNLNDDIHRAIRVSSGMRHGTDAQHARTCQHDRSFTVPSPVAEPDVEQRDVVLHLLHFRGPEVPAARNRQRPVLSPACRLVQVQKAVDAEIVRALHAPHHRVGNAAFAALDLHESAVFPQEVVCLAVSCDSYQRKFSSSLSTRLISKSWGVDSNGTCNDLLSGLRKYPNAPGTGPSSGESAAHARSQG